MDAEKNEFLKLFFGLYNHKTKQNRGRVENRDKVYLAELTVSGRCALSLLLEMPAFRIFTA